MNTALNDTQQAFAKQLAHLRQQHQRVQAVELTAEIPDSATAEAIQLAVLAEMGTTVGGWKCGTPVGDKSIIAPIPASHVLDLIAQPEACYPATSFEGTVRIEPEFAFILKQDLPPRDTPYHESEIRAAIGDIRLALEMIGYRVNDPAQLPFLAKLADGLSNHGLILGPSILNQVDNLAGEQPLTLSEGKQTRQFEGKHPNLNPWLPLYWLLNHLSATGRTLIAGTPVITGSFAGAIEVNPNTPCALQFAELGTICANWQTIAAT